MATKHALDKLQIAYDNFTALDREKILRPKLGEASLDSKLGPKIDELNEYLAIYIKHAPSVHDTYVNDVMNNLTTTTNILNQHAQLENPEFIQQSNTLLNEFTKHEENLLKVRAHFISAAVEERGLLEDEGIKRQSEIAIEDMKNKSEEALQKVREESDRIIKETKKFAEEIETKARRTATGIAVEDAQEQFEKAQEHHKNQVILWVLISSVSVSLFIGFGFYLLQSELPKEWEWQIIYYTAIKITILTAIGAISTFCLRILRAHMHMYQHNLHRQRVTNSMASFVESALTPEQRDLILGHLVDAVATFGSSGLLAKEDDAIYSPKMTIDTIARNISVPPVK